MRSHDDALRRLIAGQAAEWHVAHAGCVLDPQRAREFMRWLRTSPIHVAEYLAIAAIAKDVSRAARDSTESLQDLLAEGEEPSVRRLQAPTDDTPYEMLSPRAYHRRASGGVRRRYVSQRPIIQWVSAAAVALAASVAVIAGWHWSAAPAHVETIATRHGEERSFQLADNTHVQLDSDSAISVRFDGSSRRVVLERGQAYFRVAKAPGRPFAVRVGRSLVRDVGTAFDVYRHASNVTITVAEGRVQVWNVRRQPRKLARWLGWVESGGKPRGTPVAELGAGEQARVTDMGQVTSLGSVNVRRALAWRYGRIAFDNESVDSVTAEFNRYNNVQITIQDPRIGTLPISGMFDTHDVPTFVAFLESLPGAAVERRGQRVFVHHARRR